MQPVYKCLGLMLVQIRSKLCHLCSGRKEMSLGEWRTAKKYGKNCCPFVCFYLHFWCFRSPTKYGLVTLGQQKSNSQISFSRSVVCLLLYHCNSHVSKSHDKDDSCHIYIRFWTSIYQSFLEMLLFLYLIFENSFSPVCILPKSNYVNRP